MSGFKEKHCGAGERKCPHTPQKEAGPLGSKPKAIETTTKTPQKKGASATKDGA